MIEPDPIRTGTKPSEGVFIQDGRRFGAGQEQQGTAFGLPLAVFS